MPLFEKVKEIFKKYGFTVSAIVLAAWTVIGAVIRAITTSLKPLGKDIGKALQGVSKKTSFIALSLLPCGLDLKDGLIGGLKLKARCP